MRPKKPIQNKSIADFEKYFKAKYKGRRVLKTTFHFFSWIAGGDSTKRDKFLHDFSLYCQKEGVRASWRNAAEWHERNA
jgi:hypothetical protein